MDSIKIDNMEYFVGDIIYKRDDRKKHYSTEVFNALPKGSVVLITDKNPNTIDIVGSYILKTQHFAITNLSTNPVEIKGILINGNYTGDVIYNVDSLSIQIIRIGPKK